MASHSKIASLSSRLLEPNRSSRDDNSEDDEDAIFAELEAEIENDDNPAVREQGIGVIKRELERMKELRESHHGTYSEITDEKEVIRISSREKRCVIHFYHSNFKRCEIMDRHLARLAPKYFHTRFIRVFVENIPWLVERLSIKILPCVICFVDGVSADRLIGFEELGNNDGFETAALELRLLNAGVIGKPNGNGPVYNVVASSNAEDEEVFDLDD
ncbi:hypothetical protein AGABI1DRAFT_113355 [Agaricus bisporus var. burnettii JB137-S8]|uniref:Phosducin thioredoxin-like domain-containing protein n=1 Tax=Agaricus bisporus var. burnettii (strain JB137-S8 / ATCC MYA-4627 / FGSC 10392) TaxID=597362 RepID=K5XXX4_AGABU|nr:uncharacterized protein AGABI1DRAFT_113355 [Agaricus bisporus var. burnettii JB137-S8]EKM80150.1 hypothetical protein AGABI1DRAFT_113355 [Agaricus bisporus var. burnettii JB137-S8]